MISVIIPTLNEAAGLEALVADISATHEPFEIIVADGGSTDGTPDIAERLDLRLVAAARGRGQQLRAGADQARGDVLLFLHADSRFPQGGLAAIRSALDAVPAAPGGNFRLLFDGDDPFSRWLESFYAWIRRRGVYYGDSGMFVRRRVYDAIGGIRALELMEDFDFCRRLERSGPTICLSETPLVTSSRRFLGRQPAAIVFGWLKIHVLYFAGVSGNALARAYNSARTGERTGARH